MFTKMQKPQEPLLSDAQGKKESYLSFTLGDETFALHIDQVLEILDLLPVTKIPKSPDFLRGVINLRGKVLPIVDTRLKFGLPNTADSILSSIIVLDIVLDNEPIQIGIVVDAVNEVIEIAPSEIDLPPSIGMRYTADFLEGVLKKDDRFVLILEAAKIFSIEDFLIEKDEL
jgi:purine-binding chemotaxis protein CheW